MKFFNINYLPFAYTFNSRIITKAERISWLLIFPIFIFLVGFVFDYILSDVFFTFFLTIQIYEIGYLYNDYVTVIKEKEPTIRYIEGKEWIENNFKKLVSIKLISAISVTFFLFNGNNLFILLSMFAAILTIFYFHNTLRSRLNIITYFLLVSFRYLTPLVFFIDTVITLLIIFSFPFVRTIEHACKSKYNFLFIRKIALINTDFFRLCYYIILNSVIYICYPNLDVLICTGYFLLIRFLALIVSKLPFFRRNKHNAYK